MDATLQTVGNPQHLWVIAAGLGVLFLAVIGLVVYVMRKFFQGSRGAEREEFETSAPRTENPSAFMTASMQGVIRQLREQEKELERLHKIEKERAAQTERLSEEVTRNMPAGLLGECDGNHFQLESGRGTGAGDSRAGIPALQRSAGAEFGIDAPGGGLPGDGEDFPARGSGTHSPGR